MCLIVFALNQHPKYALILGANRDEFFERLTLPAGWWKSKPPILAGKDERGGGTWLGLNRYGKLAALTNYRLPQKLEYKPPSRGKIVTDFLFQPKNIKQYLTTLKVKSKLYDGFNLLLYQAKQMTYFSNQAEKQILKPDYYALSNGSLNNNWPKVQKIKTNFKKIIEQSFATETIFGLLCDTEKPQDEDLPQTGLSLEWERALSSIFIQKEGYGTRCSTIVLISHAGEVNFYEKTYNPNAQSLLERNFNFSIIQC